MLFRSLAAGAAPARSSAVVSMGRVIQVFRIEPSSPSPLQHAALDPGASATGPIPIPRCARESRFAGVVVDRNWLELLPSRILIKPAAERFHALPGLLTVPGR